MSLEYSDLISSTLSTHAKKIIGANENESITYYMEDFSGQMYIDRYYQLNTEWVFEDNEILINSVGNATSDKNQIRNIFNKIDAIIDLDFKEMTHNNGSQIDIYSVSSSSSFSENVVGQIISQENQAGAWFDILWKESGEKDITDTNEISTLIHELGHSFGLSHPKNDPYNINWDTDDTVMSYNIGINGWSDWFSEIDLLALKSIWGRENDNGKMNFTQSSNNYKITRNSSNQYHIKTKSGIENITELETLTFPDRDMDINQDIINVFNQITGIDNITGQIFRLYEASFNRIPDNEGFSYWLKMHNSGENTYRQIGESFIKSQEFIAKYSIDLTNSDYISNLYLNIFERSSDESGHEYWLGQLDNGIETKEEVLMGFAESDESKSLFIKNTGISF